MATIVEEITTSVTRTLNDSIEKQLAERDNRIDRLEGRLKALEASINRQSDVPLQYQNEAPSKNVQEDTSSVVKRGKRTATTDAAGHLVLKKRLTKARTIASYTRSPRKQFPNGNLLLEDLKNMSVRTLALIEEKERKEIEEQLNIVIKKIPGGSKSDWQLVANQLNELWCTKDLVTAFDILCSKVKCLEEHQAHHKAIFVSTWEEMRSLISSERWSWLDINKPLLGFALNITCLKALESIPSGHHWPQLKALEICRNLCLCDDSYHCKSVVEFKDLTDELMAATEKWKIIAEIWENTQGPVKDFLHSDILLRECIDQSYGDEVIEVNGLLTSILKPIFTIPQKNPLPPKKLELLLGVAVVSYLVNYKPSPLFETPIFAIPAKILRLAFYLEPFIFEETLPMLVNLALLIKDRKLRHTIMEIDCLQLGPNIFRYNTFLMRAKDIRPINVEQKLLSCRKLGWMCQVDTVPMLRSRDFFLRSPMMYALLQFIDQNVQLAPVSTPFANRWSYSDEKTVLKENIIELAAGWIEELVEKGAELENVDQDGVSVFHLAATGDCMILERLLRLLDGGVIANYTDLRDNFGATPLHYSAFSNQPHCVELLLKYGADINCKDGSGRTPLDIAEYFGLAHIIQILSKEKAVEIEALSEMYHVGTLSECRCGYLVESVLASPFVGRAQTDEAQVIKEDLENLLVKVSERIEETNPAYAFRVKLRGSAAEGTKVGFPDEFDFNLIMKHQRYHSGTRYQEEDEWEEAKQIVDEFRLVFAGKDFDVFFSYILHKTLNHRPIWKDIKLKLLTMNGAKVGPQLKLQWNGSTYKHMMISVDLVPLFPYESQKDIPFSWPTPVDLSGCELYTIPSSGAVCYSDVENRLMGSLPEAALDAYRFLKAILSPLFHPDFFKDVSKSLSVRSYPLKNIFMKIHCLEVRANRSESLSVNAWVSKAIEAYHRLSNELYTPGRMSSDFEPYFENPELLDSPKMVTVGEAESLYCAGNLRERFISFSKSFKCRCKCDCMKLLDPVHYRTHKH